MNANEMLTAICVAYSAALYEETAFDMKPQTPNPESQTPMSLSEIEHHCRLYADARADLATVVQTLEDKIEALKRAAMPDIKRLVARATERHAALKGHIEAGPDLFIKPRTVIFHGIKAGLQKGTGKIDWADDDQVVALIDKHFSKPEAEQLIKTTRKPRAQALAELDVAALKKLGCTVESTGDIVVIRPVDGAVDKIVNALLKEATEETQAA